MKQTEMKIHFGAKTLSASLAVCVAIVLSDVTAVAEEKPSVVTTINGETLPGQLLPLQDVSTMIDTIDANGNRLVVTKGIRKAGTRVGIHVHKHGGHTCVLSGEITGFMEGAKPHKWPAGTCYYMPPNTAMAAANLGEEDATLIDTFSLPPGEPTITILEPDYPPT
ncbi:cupin domain-containing protein [Microvirga sp. GCM10011540]|uniref:cupin domain-containing protein n=1 Tax=Microvirga sp. GCM10011540 TaxID=3317338 RepID=UPI00361ECA55